MARYFHVTKTHPSKLANGRLEPRVPSAVYEDDAGNKIEDSTTPRVSFAKTFHGAMDAVHHMSLLPGERLHIYATNHIPHMQDVSQPQPHAPEGYGVNYNHWGNDGPPSDYDYEGLVPDAAMTGEVWSRAPIQAHYLGSIDRAGYKKYWQVRAKKRLIPYGGGEYKPAGYPAYEPPQEVKDAMAALEAKKT